MMSVLSRKATLLVYFIEHLKLVDQSEVVVDIMNVYDLVWSLP